MSRSLLHDWEGSIEKNKNNTEELLKIAEDIYNTAYARGKASTERPQGEWVEKHSDYGVYYQCSICHKMPPNYECDYKEGAIKTNFCPNCGAEMKGSAE